MHVHHTLKMAALTQNQLMDLAWHPLGLPFHARPDNLPASTGLCPHILPSSQKLAVVTQNNAILGKVSDDHLSQLILGPHSLSLKPHIK